MIRLELWTPHELQLAQVEPAAENEPHVVLVGTCFGHPLKEDGAEVATGKITSVRVEKDEDGLPMLVATTIVGTDYRLGEPDRRYNQEVFPDARKKMLEWWYNKHPEEKPAQLPEAPTPIAEDTNGVWPVSMVAEDMSLAA
jgi:hypothetical protein